GLQLADAADAAVVVDEGDAPVGDVVVGGAADGIGLPVQQIGVGGGDLQILGVHLAVHQEGIGIGVAGDLVENQAVDLPQLIEGVVAHVVGLQLGAGQPVGVDAGVAALVVHVQGFHVLGVVISLQAAPVPACVASPPLAS